MSDQEELQLCAHNEIGEGLCLECYKEVKKIEFAARFVHIMDFPNCGREIYAPALEVADVKSDLGSVEALIDEMSTNQMHRNEVQYVYSYLSLWRLVFIETMNSKTLPRYFEDALVFLKERMEAQLSWELSD